MASPVEDALEAEADVDMEAVSPKNKTATFDEHIPSPPIGHINSLLTSRTDPDAQTTVTDFLDFTEYLPSDMTRSLTLIKKLDQQYTDASLAVNDLTTTWGRLPHLSADERPPPTRLRADISEQLSLALNSRMFAHDEAVRMCDNVTRHYHKATSLLAKLRTMMDNYPTEEVKSPVEPKSPQVLRAKLTVRATGENGQKIRRPRVPRITVPGEVLAPYDIEYDTFSDDSDISSDDESEVPATGRKALNQTPRIKLNVGGGGGGSGSKPHKAAGRVARPVPYTTPALTAAAAANAAALLHPPPEDAVVGSQDAPWLQLTRYELAKLRKRMKKNATWTPSETMIARELKALGRGPDAYREAKKQAEDKGEVFEARVPAPVVDSESGTKQLPAGAIGIDSLVAEQVPTINRGMKLNEAKKLKREQLAKMAAEEAEESARKMQQAAKLFLGESATPGISVESAKEPRALAPKPRLGSRSQTKRKRSADGSVNAEAVEAAAAAAAAEAAEATPTTSSKPRASKRSKTETPVPPPYPPGRSLSISAASDTSLPPSAGTAAETPVPIPFPPHIPAAAATTAAGNQGSQTPSATVASSSTAPHVPGPAPFKAPTQTPVPLPKNDISKAETRASSAATPIPPPPAREAPARETTTKRETRADVARRAKQQANPAMTSPTQLQEAATADEANRQSSSRNATPRTTPGPEAQRRTSPRGKAPSQEEQQQQQQQQQEQQQQQQQQQPQPQPPPTADRARRTSTAHNTPVPEIRPPPLKRSKRPAPGVVSTTNGGGNSAVGKRKAAPKKKARSGKRDKGAAATAATANATAATAMDVEMEEVDDEGNPIDPDEPRYCLCNNVSFGTMIQCDNVDVSDASSLSPIKKRVTRSMVEPEEEKETMASHDSDEQALTRKQNCKQEWFHLECVGLSDIPARTTKWYCPDCRRILNIGERGEVSARGVKK